MKVRLSLALLLLYVNSDCVHAGDLLSADHSIPQAIDHYINARLQQAGVTPAPQATDGVLVRRLTLDLAGRIPSPVEVTAFTQSKDADRRKQLIKRLVHSPWYARHAATEFNTLLRGPSGGGPDLRDYLLTAVRENRPWNQMFRELLGVSSAEAKPERFVLGRLKDRDLLTRDASSLFFGVNISCAQCHTHPYVESLTQDYFFGMQAFFSRSYDFEGALLERKFGTKVKFTTNAGEPREVGAMFLVGRAIETPAPDVPDVAKAISDEQKRIDALRKKFKEAKTKDPNSEPEMPTDAGYNLRAQLVEIALRPENEALVAKSIVNRMCLRFYGYALVTRVDQMHEWNEPSHPELLAWLARDLIAHGYDLRRLVSGLVSSSTYSRSSGWAGDAPPRELFAVANLRPLTPMQFGVSIVCCGDVPTDDEARIKNIEEQARKHFGELIEQPYDGLQINAAEALGMSNDSERLKVVGANLVPQLLKLRDHDAQVEAAFQHVLSRAPTQIEASALAEYLAQHKDALPQVVWALTTSTEFRFNH